MKYSIDELQKLLSKEEQIESSKAPRILIFDIETSPMIAYCWKRFKENVSLEQTIQESFMICWSAKWLLEEEIFGNVVTPEEAVVGNDKRVVESLYNTIKEADIIIAYNGKSFDIPYMNQRFFVYGFKPYEPVYIIDPYETVKKDFRFSSNKMDNIATQLGLSNKIKTDFSLWKGCLEGSVTALEAMFKYNKQDIVVLEEIYVAIRPWIKNHPHINNYFNDKNCCTKCGNNDIIKLTKKFYTPSGVYELFKCKKCGTIFRGKTNLNKRSNPFINCSH